MPVDVALRPGRTRPAGHRRRARGKFPGARTLGHPMRHALRALVLLMAATFAAAAPPAHAAGPTKLADVTIPASDGVDLVGDVYVPGDGTGRHPAVIDMEPYGRSTSTDYVDHGYVRVNTAVRGSGKRGGALW